MSAIKVGIEVQGKPLYANVGTVKLGSKGPAVQVGEVLTALPKGEARKVRKALHKAGRVRLAAAPVTRAAY